MNWLKNSWLWSGLGVVVLLGIILGPRLVPARKIDLYFGQVNDFCINNLCLKKETDKWWVVDGNRRIPADTDRTDQMIKQLAETRLEVVVSQNKDRESEMGFVESDKVEIKSNGKTLEVGTIGSDYQTTLVRIPGEVKVYAINVVWNKSSLKEVEYWKNSRVTNLPLYQIKKIIRVANRKEMVMEPKDSKWEKEALVEKIAHLNSTDYILNNPKDEPLVTYKIETETGTSTLKVGKQWATTDEKIYYSISKSDFDLLTVSR